MCKYYLTILLVFLMIRLIDIELYQQLNKLWKIGKVRKGSKK